MAHITRAVTDPVAQVYGPVHERQWHYPISEAEMRMVVSSTRGQSRLHDATVAVFNDQGQVALIRKPSYPDGAWRIPGGGVNAGEPFLAGSLREAKEETGLDAEIVRYLLRVDVTFTCGEQQQPWTTHVLVGRVCGGELIVGDPKEIDGVRWGRLSELCGPMAQVMLATGRGLFTYRVDLHREIAHLLQSETPAGLTV